MYVYIYIYIYVSTMCLHEFRFGDSRGVELPGPWAVFQKLGVNDAYIYIYI